MNTFVLPFCTDPVLVILRGREGAILKRSYCQGAETQRENETEIMKILDSALKHGYTINELERVGVCLLKSYEI
jgi:hypothetical protein